MELIDLKAEIRQGKGKSSARAIRRNNAIPAILYGPNTEPVKISVETLELNRIIKRYGSSGLFMNLAIEGDVKPSRKALLKDIQMDVYDLEYLHVDFQEVDLDVKITVSVPVETSGESIGVKKGGLLQVIRRELDIICKPTDMPEAIVLDVASLEVGDSIHVEEIDLGSDIEVPHEVNFTVVTIVAPAGKAGEEAGEEGEDFIPGDLDSESGE